MESILLVKTSSLGDVVHNLPVVSEMRRAWRDVAVDWVVDEAFTALPRLHAGVAEVIPVAIRRWRGALGRAATWREIRQFVQRLRSKRYDAVLDTQGLLKSALIAAAARGCRYGLDWASSREPLRMFYDRTFGVSWSMHAVERNRALAARALGFALAPHPEYGIHARAASFPWQRHPRYVVFLHSTSAAGKLWGEPSWAELAARCMQRGWGCVLPWGSEEERARSARLAVAARGAVTPPALGLDELAGLLAGAHAVAGVDTGLTHLAAALGIPTVGIFCATDPAATGLYACRRAVNLGGIGSPPSVDDVMHALDEREGTPS